MKKHDTETTIQDVLIAINQFSSLVDGEFSNVRNDILEIKHQMVTKDYLDDKLADLKGELIGTIRREDQKVNTVVSTLQRKQLLSANDVKPIRQINVLLKGMTK